MSLETRDRGPSEGSRQPYGKEKMATVHAPISNALRDDSVSPMTRSLHDASPDDVPAGPSNGQIQSPLRVERSMQGWTDGDNEMSTVASEKSMNLARMQMKPPPEPMEGSFSVHDTPDRIQTENGMKSLQAQEMSTISSDPTRTVQFARDTANMNVSASGTKRLGRGMNANETPSSKDGRASLMMKLKSLRPPSSTDSRAASDTRTSAAPNSTLRPESQHRESSYVVEPAEAADADVEDESEDQGAEATYLWGKRRRHSKRPVLNGEDSAGTTPKTARFASFVRDYQLPSPAVHPVVARRATTSEVNESQPDLERLGVSEDEGRDRIRTAWRRGVGGARHMSHGARNRTTDGEMSDGAKPRPGNTRRLTSIAMSESGSLPFRSRTDRQGSLNTQRWRQVKAGLRILGQKRGDERVRVDHQKSAQLMAELLAGAPAALFFASMYQRDEHGHRKIPVLLEQLKLRIPHSENRVDKAGDRHLVFRIELEYGNGPARMQWAIRRSLQDFVQLHLKYKSQVGLEKVTHLRGDDKNKAKMPRFPKSAFPYARGARGLFDPMKDEDEDAEGPTHDSILDGEASGPERLDKQKVRKPSLGPPRRTSTGELLPKNVTDPSALTARQRELYAERQRKKLEAYLQQMIRWLIFRADSTRLCKFLELSALAIRLSAEGGPVGKQGLMTIVTPRKRELRRKLPAFGGSIERHTPKWFLVRHSYIVCVDGPESLNPYDVFLVDSEFRCGKRREPKPTHGAKQQHQKLSAQEAAKMAPPQGRNGKHLIRLENSERKLKLLAKSERQWIQFQESLNEMAAQCIWAQKQRYGAFAPVRHKVWARWLVDGRDHMWQASKAIDNAKDFIYIHDWWLSPELYLRRPAAISQQWRLDRLLQRKAQEGVKIFVIIYRNIESAIPIDSEYTKWALLDLHENICIQRSPNQFRQNQFFWAHHEKLLVVDNMMAFVGGIDLCFGRWDDPCHSLTDDKLTGFESEAEVPRDSDHVQVWPGKDYSNPRVQDFYALDKPYEEMYDRTKVPRMPWHDIHMQLVGQPARDIGRHFVQRWNYILRSRVPSRPTPVLLPPPEFDENELESLGMTGTCQVQIVRSCSAWSIGLENPRKVEKSIQTAYCDLIQNSDHFVYIENQFFISSCTVESTVIRNQIGDALVERAVRAYENGEAWQACIVIPLMPGFQNSVDSADGTSVRLIMEGQFRSICRGETSIFGRLRAKGIEPEDYIRFYSLRQWGKIGPRKCLTTEQLYIHAKCMVVDDRTAIIGSANINERSMVGERDSEVCAIVTDTKMIPSFMAGKRYLVGEFAHTLRMRLQREHLGLDVDAIYRRDQAELERRWQTQKTNGESRAWDSTENFATPQQTPRSSGEFRRQDLQHSNSASQQMPGRDFATTVSGSPQGFRTSRSKESPRAANSRKRNLVEVSHDRDVEGYGADNTRALMDAGEIGFTDSFVDSEGRETLSKKDNRSDFRLIVNQDQVKVERPSESQDRVGEPAKLPPWPTERTDTVYLGFPSRSLLPELPAADDTDIGGPSLVRNFSSPSVRAVDTVLKAMRQPEVHEDCMTDPIASKFYDSIWHTVADNNTKLFRQVFRCQPDSEVLDWKTYHKFNAYNEAFIQAQGLESNKSNAPKGTPNKSGPPGSAETVEEKAEEGRARSKTLLGGFVDKLRPSSKNEEDDQYDGVSEKNHQPAQGSPGSPLSGVSSGVATAVPTPDIRPMILDEKAAAKLSEGSDGKTLTLTAPATQENSNVTRQRTVTYSDSANLGPEIVGTQSTQSTERPASQRRRRRATTKSSRSYMESPLGREEAEELLKIVQGSLVLWPYNWLEKEEWLYPIDTLAPIEIYD